MRTVPLARRALLLAAVALAAIPVVVNIALAQTPDQPALVVVKLPPGAESATVAFGSHVTSLQKGLERWYVTPPLVAGKSYYYDLTATWMADGKEVKKTQKVSVTAGREAMVDFTTTVVTKEELKHKEGHKAAKARTFRFTYATTIAKVAEGKTVKIWIPMPPTTTEQQVTVEMESVPGKSTIGTEPVYGNKMMFIETTPGKTGDMTVSITYKITRKEVLSSAGFKQPATTENVNRFLQPDKLVPLDGKPLELVKDVKLAKEQFQNAKIFYDIVNRHMKYSKEGKGWGNGDAVWACDSKFGNCTDFHSLFISLARSQKIPTKFEMGFPIPEKRGKGPIGGYHCWAWFLPDAKGWVPVDISEANRFPELSEYYFGNLSEDRVYFSTGRDIDLTPKQNGPALNYFIYPYVEVDGQPLPTANIHNSFSYIDT